MAGVGVDQSRDIDQIGDHGGGGWARTRTGPVVKRCAHSVALNEHGVHHAFDVGD